MGKFHVGQTTAEGDYKDYEAFIAGNLIAQDIYLTNNDSIKSIPLTKLIVNLINKVDQLSKEVAQLKVIKQTRHIYTKDTISNE